MDKYTINIILQIATLLIFIGALAFCVAGIYSWVKTGSRTPTEPIGAIIQGNSLLPISPLLYPEYRVYGDVISDLVECESGGKHEGVWGKENEYGIAQFKEKTFYWLAELSRLQNPNWFNKEQQLYLLNWAIENGYGKEWSCFNK